MLYLIIYLTALPFGRVLFFIISGQYDRKTHQKLADSLEEALSVREELRKKWWPNYKQ